MYGAENVVRGENLGEAQISKKKTR